MSDTQTAIVIDDLRRRVTELEKAKPATGDHARDRKPGSPRWSSKRGPDAAYAPKRTQHSDALRFARHGSGETLNVLAVRSGLTVSQLQTLEGGGGSIRGLFAYARALSLQTQFVGDIEQFNGMRVDEIAVAGGCDKETVCSVIELLQLKDPSESLVHIESVVRVVSTIGGFIEVA